MLNKFSWPEKGFKRSWNPSNEEKKEPEVEQAEVKEENKTYCIADPDSKRDMYNEQGSIFLRYNDAKGAYEEIYDGRVFSIEEAREMLKNSKVLANKDRIRLGL